MNKTSQEFLFAEKSDVGKVRKINEDSFGNLKTKNGHYFFVCDGMGGHEYGEVASSMAVELIKKNITKYENVISEINKLLELVLDSANKEINDYSVRNSKIKGMGTTCVLVYITRNKAYYANVGDSRLYLISNNIVSQLTKDQSFVQELVNQNLITQDEAENHPRKNEILQALGLTAKIVPDISPAPVELSNGDFLLLCSDGLSNFVNESLMLSLIKPGEPGYSCNELISAANNAGGRDNITVQLIEFNGLVI